MSESEFPPNSDASRKGPSEKKKVEPIISGGAKRRKRSLRKQVRDTLIAGNPRDALRWTILEVGVPEARDLLVELVNAITEKWIRGESYRRRGGGAYPPQTGASGWTPYNKIPTIASRFTPSGPQRAISRTARAQHNFDEIVLDQRVEAEEVIDRLFDLVNEYGSASVQDLYELVGLPFTHTDNKWGWTDLQGAGVSRIHGGYLLDLPDPHPIG